MEKPKDAAPVVCECGKVIAVKKGDKIILMCKKCKRQIEFKL